MSLIQQCETALNQQDVLTRWTTISLDEQGSCCQAATLQIHACHSATKNISNFLRGAYHILNKKVQFRINVTGGKYYFISHVLMQSEDWIILLFYDSLNISLLWTMFRHISLTAIVLPTYIIPSFAYM